jgi:hypothetical protein
MAAGPGILDQLRALGSSAVDALKGRYASGPPVGAPSAGPGSVLDQHVSQARSLSPSPAPQRPLVPTHVAQDSGARYGDRPGEKRIDTTEMTKPLAGLSGIQRK